MLVFYDPTLQRQVSTSTIEEAEQAIASGYQAILPSGAVGHITEFEGGRLLEGTPLNVWIYGTWYTGQQEILAPLWQNGTVPAPPPDVLQVPITDAPQSVVQQYAAAKGVPGAQTLTEAYQTGQAIGGGSGLSSMALIGLAGVALLWLASGGKRGSRMLQ
jgi:hypothetical protein